MNPVLRAAGATMLALVLVTGPARAVCTYNPLTSDVSASPSATPTLYQFTQATDYWSAFAVRPQPGQDWDITVFGATAADPACVASPLASSAFGSSQVDFVIGDFNFNTETTYYPSVNRFSGSGPATVQWDDGPDLITVNGTPVTQSMASTDLIRVYDVFLSGGTSYNFDFFPQSGQGGHLLLFRNALGGTYWTGRSGAQFDATGPTAYVAPASGYYGVVVVSDLGSSFTYSLAVTSGSCPIPTTLAAGSTVNIPPSDGNMAFDAESNYWSGVAVRAVSGDWDTQLFDLPGGGVYPTCFSTLAASSAQGASQADITIGDFNLSPFGWYFAHPYMFSGGASCDVEYTGTAGILDVNEDPIFTSIAAANVAVARDVYLQSGHTYAITFSPSAAGLTLLLFANPGGGTYIAGRASALLSTTTSTTFTATVSGWHGLVVMNDGAIAGNYTLGVGDCSLVTALVNDATAGAGARNSYFSFDQETNFWTAVAVRNTLGVDWDLVVNQDNVAAPEPACATLPLASSGFSPSLQDFVVGDFDYNTEGTYYVHAHQFTGGAVSPAVVEWDSGMDVIYPNDNNATTRGTGGADVIGCWDVLLTGGQQYQFNLAHSGGADLHLLLFRNPGGTYWAGRASAVFTTTTTVSYAAPSSGYYGVVVVNDNGAVDNYAVTVKTCDPVAVLPPAPGTLTSGSGGLLDASFTQSSNYWTPVAVRANDNTEDWDLVAYTAPSGGPIGVCLSGGLANSAYGSGATDFVVGDFNFVPKGTYYAGADRFFGISSGSMQYFPGGQLLIPGAAPQVRNKPLSFMVESWDALLSAGQQYSIRLSHDPAFKVKVDVFQSTGVPFWGGRSAAMVETPTTATFTAPTSGFYGIVVVNDGGQGTFDVSLNTGLTAVDGNPPPERDALRDIAPNPGRAGLHLDYALHEGGPVAFEVLDMAGRRVTRFEPGEKGAGQWSAAWAATDEGGRPLHPGLYFVRMRVGDRVVGTRKLTLLE